MKFGMSVRSALVAPLALGCDDGWDRSGRAGADAAPAQPTPDTAATQTPPARQQRRPHPQQAENPTFSAPAGMLLVQIKPDKTADYEAMIAKLKDALAKSEKPERKAMAKAWKVYKATEPAAGNTLYVHVIDADRAW